MTDVKAQPSTSARLRGLLTTPDEGWSALAAVLIMMLVAGVAIDESHWVGSTEHSAEYLAVKKTKLGHIG